MSISVTSGSDPLGFNMHSADVGPNQDELEAAARRRAGKNWQQSLDLAQGAIDRTSQPNPEDQAFKSQLSDIVSGQGGAGGERARTAEIARATDQAASAAGARAMTAAGATGVNAGAASRAFNVQNLTTQQQDVQKARQNFDATFGAREAGDQMDAGRTLAGLGNNQESQRQAAEDRLRQMLLSQEFSAKDAGPTDRYGRPITTDANGATRRL